MCIDFRDSYPGIVCDLDGVVYRGPDAIPHAVEHLSRENPNSTGGVIYATNNASRPPEQVARHLIELGLTVTHDQVINSSVTGAQVLADRLCGQAAVLAVGGVGVAQALREVGLIPITAGALADDGGEVEAVLQGYGPDVCARDLAEIAYAVQGGAQWVVTNDDRTLPTERGVAPGNGSLVAAVRMAVDPDPEVVGKPGPLMYELAAQRLGTDSEHTLGIGDRLETDVAGAHAAGMDALLVLTGVHGVVDLVSCSEDLRPRFVALDLRSLDDPYEEPVQDGSMWRTNAVCGWLDKDDGTPALKFADGDSAPDADTDADTDADSAEVGSQIWHDEVRIALRVLWSAIDRGQLSPEAACSAAARWQ